ncbi:unnamed protein product [Diplocarpon coronariae]
MYGGIRIHQLLLASEKDPARQRKRSLFSRATWVLSGGHLLPAAASSAGPPTRVAEVARRDADPPRPAESLSRLQRAEAGETKRRDKIPTRDPGTSDLHPGKGGGEMPTCRRADVEHVPEGGEPVGTGRNRHRQRGGEGRARGWPARHLLLSCSSVGRRASGGRSVLRAGSGGKPTPGRGRAGQRGRRCYGAPLPLLSRSGSRSARPLCRADETRGGPDGRHTPRSRRGSGSGLDSPGAGGFRRETAGRGSADQKSGRGGRWGEMGGGRGVMKEG